MRQTETPRIAQMIADRAADQMNLGGGATKGVQLKFRATSNLREMIEGAAKSNGRNASEEIRSRLELSFLAPAQDDDPQTRELVSAISWAVRAYKLMAEGEQRSWVDDPRAFATVRAAIMNLVDRYRPEGEIPEDDGGAAMLANVALLHAKGEL